MRGYNIPPWPPGYGWRRGGESVPAQEMRVSDAERQVIAEALSRHFGDGRLDRAEFDERMGKAMAAKTRGELAGLLRDLPPLPDPRSESPPPRRRRSRAVLLLLAGFLLFAISSSWSWHSWAWHTGVWRPHLGFPVLLVLALVFLYSRRSARYHHGHYHDPMQ